MKSICRPLSQCVGQKRHGDIKSSRLALFQWEGPRGVFARRRAARRGQQGDKTPSLLPLARSRTLWPYSSGKPDSARKQTGRKWQWLSGAEHLWTNHTTSIHLRSPPFWTVPAQPPLELNAAFLHAKKKKKKKQQQRSPGQTRDRGPPSLELTVIHGGTGQSMGSFQQSNQANRREKKKDKKGDRREKVK